ncbi:hypothetical protein EJ02DRAFT_420340 [Clathrospora elynae]|uniref:Uncharacterized protein n=1 Tax=Clathrospora elynae TaxID=706981 RepID=A0A6A5SV34_9PLEO|nr:hypothetical protein EJ02DRAFT_420340 [Clathrospora elynae]
MGSCSSKRDYDPAYAAPQPYTGPPGPNNDAWAAEQWRKEQKKKKKIKKILGAGGGAASAIAAM